MTRANVQMFHKVTANQIVLIAQAALPVGSRSQQEPCVLDAAGRQDDDSRAYLKRLSGQCRNLKGSDPRCLRLEIHGREIRVNDRRNILCRDHPRAVDVAEICLWAELKERILET
jgi:hypothetical protein